MHLMFYSNRGEKFLSSCQKGKCLNKIVGQPYDFMQICRLIFNESANLALYLMFMLCHEAPSVKNAIKKSSVLLNKF